MAIEEPNTEVAKEAKPNKFAALLARAVKLDWLRPLIHHVGGRKMVMGGGGMALITLLVGAGDVTWPKAVACLAVAITAAAGMFSTAWEDRSDENL